MFRYLVAGSMGFLANFSVYLLCLKGGISYVPASVVAFLAGMVISFLAQKFFAFQNRAAGETTKQIIMHVTLLAFNLGANTLILMFLVERGGVGEITASVVTNIVVAVWSFFIYKLIIFRKTQEIII